MYIRRENDDTIESDQTKKMRKMTQERKEEWSAIASNI